VKAAVLNTPKGPLDIEEIRIDKPGPREVLVRTAASGVCHSDLHLINMGMPGGAPIVPGHEPAGVVEQVGSDVTYAKPGDRVIACLSIFCGVCDLCVSGRSHLCGGRMFDRGEGDPPRLSRDGTPVLQMSQISSFGWRSAPRAWWWAAAASGSASSRAAASPARRASSPSTPGPGSSSWRRRSARQTASTRPTATR